MPSPWSRIAGSLARIAVREGPRLLQEVQRRRSARQLPTSARRPGPAGARPRTGPPPASAQRLLVYAPNLDGRADPGEIVWTWVAYEEDASRGKDRPVLVVGRDRWMLLGLMLSSQSDHEGEPGWHGLGTGSWDPERRPSWVRLDRVLEVAEDEIRREGAVLDRRRFDRVAAMLRADHGWR
ncbi:MAG: type II toxin-antitoxin system PemK/MazF family toxin [Actinomycetes bacterium]